MNQVQLRMMDLLAEIHDICEKNNIVYTLGADTAAMLYTYRELLSEECQPAVYMTFNEFEKFKSIVLGTRNDDRIIEGMNNNPRFPGFFFRYVDKNTTMFSYKFGDTYICNGISITIEVLRKYKKKSNEKLRLLEKGFAFNSFKYKRWLSFKNKMLKLRVKLKMITGRKRLCNRLYSEFCTRYRVKDFETYYSYVNLTTFTNKKYPSYLYMNRQILECGEYRFYISEDLHKQYKIVERANLDNYSFTAPAVNFLFMASANVPYEESGIDIKRARKISGKRQYIWLLDGVHGILPYIMDKDWNILKCVSARLDMKNMYMPLKEELLGLYKKADFEELSVLLEKLDRNTRLFYRTTKKTIYFDREIFGIYTAWLEHKRRRKLAARLASKIPSEWR